MLELCRVLPIITYVCKMYVIVNKQVKFLTSQCIGTCKRAYTKDYALN